MENIHNADALATSDQVRIENISANQKFEAFITSLAHIVEKYGIGLNFPVFKDGKEVSELLWDKGNTVETVVGLNRKI